jgi:hypothetical protein
LGTPNDKRRRVECCGIPLKPKYGLTPISCHAVLERSACAPFVKERRMKCINAPSLRRKSGQGGTQPSLPVKQAKIAMDARPGGPTAQTSAQPGRAGDRSEGDLSAVGAALSSHRQQKLWVPHCPDFLRRLVTLIHFMRLPLAKAHMRISLAPRGRKSGSSRTFT